MICGDGQFVAALDAATGEPQWTQKTLLTEIRDMFVAGGSLWEGGFKPIEGKRGPSWGPYFVSQTRSGDGGDVAAHRARESQPPPPLLSEQGDRSVHPRRTTGNRVHRSGVG